jgi:NitT/TauT family transport system substrate-binding protein
MRRFGGPRAAVVCAAAGLVTVFAAPAQSQSPKLWRHGIVEPKSDAGLVLMVTQKDFAERFGLKIDVVKFKNGGLAVKALLAGEIDSIEAGAAEGIVAAAQGADLKIAGCTWPGQRHVVLARAAIAGVEDLKGKTIGASAPGLLPDLLTRALLDKHGVAASDVKLASFAADPDRYRALLAGAIDAAVVTSDYVPIAPKDIRLLAAGRDVVPKFVRLCIEMTGKTLQERRGEAARFLAAEITAMRHARCKKDEALKLTRDATAAKPDDPRPEFVYDESVRNADYDPSLPIPLEKLAWMQEQLVKIGSIKQPIDCEKMVDRDVRAKAMEVAGKDKGGCY